METSENKINALADGGWERGIIEKIALAAIAEQAKARRWGIIFKSLTFLYLTIILGMAIYPSVKGDISVDGKDHTASIDIVGEIGEGKEANAEDIIKSLRAAVKDKHTKGIIFHANSPGGSPVQSSLVYDEIQRIKKEHSKLPIYTVVSDICASGCYFIASATDKIFVNSASLIGSIGVLMNGFGFVDTMQKLGVERRLVTAGSHKAMLDMFSPENKEDTAYIQGLIDQVHQQFIKAVKDGRGTRLKESPEIFSGLVWTGEASIKNGIADALGDDDTVAKKEIGAQRRVDFTKSENLIDRIADKLGSSFGHALGSLVDTPGLR